jgi:FHS family L-fucose permease-like MFS transporter
VPAPGPTRPSPTNLDRAGIPDVDGPEIGEDSATGIAAPAIAMNRVSGVGRMNGKSAGHGASFATVTTLFFTWGFITSAIDPLIRAVREIFALGYAESMLTLFAFFVAYGVVSLPAGMLVARIGYVRSIAGALLAMLVGCLVMPAATRLDTYALVLAGLFVIAGGITVLQVAANPLAASLGRPETSHLRLTLSQAFNSLGTVLGPYFGSKVMLRGGLFDAGADHAAGRAQSLGGIATAFLIVAALIVLLTLFIWRFRRRLDEAPAPAPADSARAALAALGSRWALFGAAAIFLYVGAEVSIGGTIINFLQQPDILAVSAERGAELLSLYWLGAMLGRFAGSLLLAFVPAYRLLAAFAGIAAVLCLTVSLAGGAIAATVVLSIGLVNSIMFPTIFTLTLERSTASVAATSGLLCMAIVGGAILPLSVGLIADAAGLHAAYLVPMLAYGCIAAFALGAGQARRAATTEPASPPGRRAPQARPVRRPDA